MKTWNEVRKNITSLTEEEKREIEERATNKAKEILGKDCTACGFCYTAWNFGIDRIASWCQNTEKGCHLIEDLSQANECKYFNDCDWFGD